MDDIKNLVELLEIDEIELHDIKMNKENHLQQLKKMIIDEKFYSCLKLNMSAVNYLVYKK